MNKFCPKYIIVVHPSSIFLWGVLVLIVNINLCAQSSKLNWIFADHHFSFNDSVLELVERFDIDPNAMCGNNISLINDEIGNISIYTDGLNLFDRDHDITPNGSELKARFLSNNSLILIPDLFVKGEHYMFYLPEEFSPVQGIWYSIIDMTLNEGKGDIVEDRKNITLFSEITFSYLDIVRGECESLLIIAKEAESQNVYFIEIDPIQVNESIIRIIEGISFSDYPAKGGISVNELTQSIVIHNGLDEAIYFNYDEELNISEINKLPFDSSTRISSAGSFSHTGEYYFALEETNYFDDPNIDDSIKIYRYGPFQNSENLDKAFVSLVSNNNNSITLGSDNNLYLLNIGDLPGNNFESYLGQIKNPNQDDVFFKNDFYKFPKIEGRNLCLFNANNKNIVDRRLVDLCYSINSDEELCTDEKLELNINFINDSDISYLWSTGDTSATIVVDDIGHYFIEANVSGCIVRDTIEVIASTDCPPAPSDCNTYLPNSISLSSNRGNDSFMPVSNCEVQDYRLEIYDRWGGRIYQSSDPTFPWDGRSSNYEIQSGVYSYAIRYRYTSDGPMTYHTGTISVIR